MNRERAYSALAQADPALGRLVAVKGIGIWSAEMLLIHQLHRPDVFPAGDVGLRNAIQRVYGIPEPLSIPREQVLSLGWRPLRSYASALLWRSFTAVEKGP